MREVEALKSGTKLGWDSILAITAASAAFAVVVGAGYVVDARFASRLGTAVGVAAIFGMAFWLIAIVFAAPVAAAVHWLAILLRFGRGLLFLLVLGVVCSFLMAMLLDLALRPLSVSPGMLSVQTELALHELLTWLNWTAPACVVGAATFWARTRHETSS